MLRARILRLLSGVPGRIEDRPTTAVAHWRKIASTNPLERLNKEVTRRANVVSIFPNEASVIPSSAPCSPPPTTNGKPATAATSPRVPWPRSTPSAIPTSGAELNPATQHRGSPRIPTISRDAAPTGRHPTTAARAPSRPSWIRPSTHARSRGVTAPPGRSRTVKKDPSSSNSRGWSSSAAMSSSMRSTPLPRPSASLMRRSAPRSRSLRSACWSRMFSTVTDSERPPLKSYAGAPWASQLHRGGREVATELGAGCVACRSNGLGARYSHSSHRVSRSSLM